MVAALLLFPAIIWFDLRFSLKQASLPTFEIEGLLIYTALCGWVLPLAMTGLYCFSAAPRPPTGVEPAPQQMVRPRAAVALNPPRYQPGVVAPFVFGEDSVWAWLEYGSGNFLGQRLALKRAVAMIGRDEECDIWVDDDMASRYHAEVAWDQGRACLTDCGSLNGVSLNGRRVRGTVQLQSNDLIEIGMMRFIFILAEQKESVSPLDDDPLSKHTWRSSLDLQMDSLDGVDDVEDVSTMRTNADRDLNDTFPVTRPDGVPLGELRQSFSMDKPISEPGTLTGQSAFSLRAAGISGTLEVQDGEFAGRRLVIDRPVLTVGRGSECTIVMNDASISRIHIQFLQQADGDYIQDLGSSNGTLVNGEPLSAKQLLKRGDIVSLGNIHLRYTPPQRVDTSVQLPASSSPSLRVLGGPMPLKLPSRMKQN